MALPNLVVSAVAEWNGKALTKASGQIGKFDKTVKNLGRTLGVTFSAAALLGYSKKALAAYGEQIAEAKRLDQALRNIGFTFASAEAEGYLDSIEKVTGINRDQLQPAFIELAQITRSTTIAQSMLNTALEVSAGTGLDLISTTKILGQAYVGNYKGLKQLNLGLTNAELATKSYLDIEKLLATQYAGQSKNAAESYQGSLNRLKIAAEQASEEIGQGLVSALSISSGGFDKLIAKVDSAGNHINGLVTNIAYLIAEMNKIPGAGILDNFAQSLKSYIGTFSIGNFRKLYDEVFGKTGGFPQGVPQDLINLQTNVEKGKMDKLAIARQKELLALQKKAQAAAMAALKAKKLALAIDKANIALGKGASVFDLEGIQINAALINQAKQLGDATSSAQILAISNDIARLNVKKSMYELEKAIESGDVVAIENATKKLNADLQILGALTGQKNTLATIKTILDSLLPKDLINLQNLREAIALLTQISAGTGGGGGGGGGGNGFVQTPNGISPTTPPRSVADINRATEALGGVPTYIGDNGREYTPNTGMLSGISPGGREFNFSVTVNAGIGDPNAIAEAVNQVLQDAVDRGTLRAGSY